MPGTGTTGGDDLKAQFKALSDEVATLTALMRQFGETATGELGDSLRAKADEIARRGGALKDEAAAKARAEIGALEQQIAEKPLQSALIAFVVGVLFGAMTRR